MNGGNRRQWSLKSLFVAPLFLSPLFLSANLVRRGHDDATTGFNMLACAAIYAGIFAARAGLRRQRNAKPSQFSVLCGAAVGARFGLIFMGLAVGPALVAEAIERANNGQPVLILLWAFGMFVLLFGMFLGAFGGSAAGVVLECIARRSAATADDDGSRAE